MYGPPDDLITRFIEAVKRSALKPERCAWALGVDPQDVRGWMQTGRNCAMTDDTGHTPLEIQCLKFYKGINRADSEVEEALLFDVRSQTGTDWRAAMALLEKRFPDSWGKVSSVSIRDLTKIDPSKMSEAELSALIKDLDTKE